MTSAEYLNEVREREQAAAEGPWGLYRDPANPDVSKLVAMLGVAVKALENIREQDKQFVRSDVERMKKPSWAEQMCDGHFGRLSRDSLSDIEQIARGEK